MAIYDTEEEQVEALKAWWKENGRALIAGSILGAAVIIGWDFWQRHQQEQALEASVLYQQLLAFNNQEQDDSVDKVVKKLIEDFASSNYTHYARLMQAKLKVNAGDLSAAKTILENLLQYNDVEIKNVARIRLVRLMLANKEYEQGLQLISEVDAAKTESFSAHYDELTGDLYVALNRLGEARTAYQKAMRTAQGTPLLQMKLDDITATDIIVTPKS